MTNFFNCFQFTKKICFTDKIKQEDIKNLSTKLSETLETKSEASFSDFLQQQQSTNLILLQLPDTLPATISKEIAMDQDNNPTIETDVAENGLKQQKNNFCTLQDLPEGQIGKLVRYKSGKMKLVLGNGHFYDVTQGIDSTYLQVNIFFIIFSSN